MREEEIKVADCIVSGGGEYISSRVKGMCDAGVRIRIYTVLIEKLTSVSEAQCYGEF